MVSQRQPGLQTVPVSAVILDRQKESADIVTLKLKIEDARLQRQFEFQPGQFNMLYLPGAGEIAVSIVSDPDDAHEFSHTLRAVGRVSQGISRLDVNDRLGIRGPFGQGWPLQDAVGKNVLVVSGGLGCAPVVSVIHYILKRRTAFGKLNIIQGLKHSQDLIWRTRYDQWNQLNDVSVHLAADVGGCGWPWHVGRVTELFSKVDTEPAQTVVMMCGPEGMMTASAQALLDKGFQADDIFVSLERNMQCGIGHCGHCQLGPYFLCTDGPVFSYSAVSDLLGTRGV